MAVLGLLEELIGPAKGTFKHTEHHQLINISWRRSKP